MVSVEDPNSFENPSPKPVGRSIRTIRSSVFVDHLAYSLPQNSAVIADTLTDSFVDLTLGDLASASIVSPNSCKQSDGFLQLSQAFSDFSTCSSDISGELLRLACLPSSDYLPTHHDEPDVEPCLGFLLRDNFSTEIIENISPEDLLPTVKICIEGLQSSSISVKRSAAAKLRLLAKNRSDNRALIGESGAVPALIPLLRSADPWTQEHAVTALLNLSLHESNKTAITEAGAIKSLVYVLKTGTETSKQNAACALLSLALEEENRSSIGASGAIPPLVSLLLNGSNRGKKDAMTTLYKLCSIKQNKERAVTAGAVKPLVALVAEQGTGLAEKAMVVLSSLAGIAEGKETIVEEGGIPVLVETIEDGSVKEKEFSVSILVQLCVDNVQNRGLLVREGVIPPLVALSQTGSLQAKHKAETLLAYLREPRSRSTSANPDRNSSSSSICKLCKISMQFWF